MRQQQVIVLGSDVWLKKSITASARHAAARLESVSEAWMLESRAERRILSAASDMTAVDVGLDFLSAKP